MSSKHEGAPWYHSQLGIDCKLPSTFFKVTTAAAAPSVAVSTISYPDSTQFTDPSEATIPVSVLLALEVPETDTLEHIPDAEDELADEPDIEPESSSTKQGIDIESLTVTNLKEITRFLPSDLRQYHYFGGGRWLGHHQREDSKTCFFAAELASKTKGTGLPAPEEGEDRLLRKKRKHPMHLFIKEHGGKIWRADDPKDNPNGGVSMV